MTSTKPDNKQKYKGLFNWCGMAMTFYCHARSEEHAFSLFTARVAKKVERTRQSVYHYFSDQTRDGYYIDKVTKAK